MNTYSPSLGTRLLGGLQWAVTTMVIVGMIGALYSTYLIEIHTGNISGSVSYARPVIVSMILSFMAGYLWVTRRTMTASQETREHGQRIDYLLVLWFGWPGLYAGLSHLFRRINMDLLNRPFVFPVVYCLGGVLFTIFIVYYLRIELASRFVG
jgi:hypothetical protein